MSQYHMMRGMERTTEIDYDEEMKTKQRSHLRTKTRLKTMKMNRLKRQNCYSVEVELTVHVLMNNIGVRGDCSITVDDANQ